MYRFNFFIIYAKYNGVYRVETYSLHNYSSFTWFIPSNPQVAQNESFNSETNISWRQHNGAHWREDFEFW